jgi:hypothetical protein
MVWPQDKQRTWEKVVGMIGVAACVFYLVMIA